MKARGKWLLLPVLALAMAGCGGPKVHPVKGQVVVEGGEITPLVNGHVELVSDKDEEIRASGKIGADGRFQVQSQLDGQLLKGAPPGTYKARVILPQGGDDAPPVKYTGPRVSSKYLNYKTSGISVQVPAENDEITVTVGTNKK